MHLSYSDGIATVSVFEQRGRLDEAAPGRPPREVVAGSRGLGARTGCRSRVVWTSGEHGLHGGGRRTGAYGGPVVAALPHHPAADDDTLGRLGRGLDRVASWFNPFA